MIAPDTFKKFILEEVNTQNLSLRQIAREIDVSAAHLSQMLNQKTGVNPDVLNNLATLFNRDRTEIYAAAGILDFDGDELILNQFKEAITNDESVRDLFSAVLRLERTDREHRIRLILAAMGE